MKMKLSILILGSMIFLLGACEKNDRDRISKLEHGDAMPAPQAVTPPEPPPPASPSGKPLGVREEAPSVAAETQPDSQSQPTDDSPQAENSTSTSSSANQETSKISLQAKLINPEEKVKNQAATVEVTVLGVELIDPAKVNEEPKKGQGHLHYQVDDGIVIATPQNKLSFHGLTPGAHTIKIILAANDHSPLGPQQVLKVQVPAGAKP